MNKNLKRVICTALAAGMIFTTVHGGIIDVTADTSSDAAAADQGAQSTDPNADQGNPTAAANTPTESNAVSTDSLPYSDGKEFDDFNENDSVKDHLSVKNSGTNLTITLTNPSAEYKEVKVAVWSECSGQDDLQNVSMTKGADGSWSVIYSNRNLKHSRNVDVHVLADGNDIANTKIYVTDEDYFQTLMSYSSGNDSNIDYLTCAINIAMNDKIGYGHTWPQTISCAGLVGLCLTYCGYADFITGDSKNWGYIDVSTDDFENRLRAAGFQEITGPFNQSTCSYLQPGDVLFYYEDETHNHVGFYLGNGKTVEARGPASDSDNDDNHTEISVYDWYHDGGSYQKAFRLPSNKIHKVGVPGMASKSSSTQGSVSTGKTSTGKTSTGKTSTGNTSSGNASSGITYPGMKSLTNR